MGRKVYMHGQLKVWLHDRHGQQNASSVALVGRIEQFEANKRQLFLLFNSSSALTTRSDVQILRSGDFLADDDRQKDKPDYFTLLFAHVCAWDSEACTTVQCGS